MFFLFLFIFRLNQYVVNEENYFFCSYFRHISLFVYSNFKRVSLLDVEFNFTSNEYPHYILLIDPATPKTRNTWKKKVMMMSSSHFFRCFQFLGYKGPSKVCREGTHWMWNLTSHPMSSPDLNLSKNTGRYVEHKNKNGSFLYDTYPHIYIRQLFKRCSLFEF